jgi:KaiC/GvpD/RAD55 family RecA-like ATPase
LDGRPERSLAKRHIVRGVIALGESIVIAGPPKGGKSALVTDLIASIGSGEDWRGYQTRRQVGTVYIALERSGDVARMLRAQGARRGIDRLPVAVASGMLNLLDPDSVEILIDTMRAAKAALGIEIEIVILDTIAKAIAAGGGDEDRARDMGRALANLSALREQTGAATIIIAHTSKSEEGGPRGSSALVGDADTVIQIRVRGDSRVAEVTHSNDRQTGVLTTFSIEPAEIGIDEDGEPITTRIVTALGTANVTEPDPRENMSPDQRLILLALRQTIDVTDLDGNKGNAIWRSNVTKALHGRSDGAIRKAFSEGRKALQSKGLIEETDGCYRVTELGLVTLGNVGNRHGENVTVPSRTYSTGGVGNISQPKPQSQRDQRKLNPKPGAPKGARPAAQEGVQ